MTELPRTLRVATYNVHGCIGTDGRVSEARVADVVRELDCDVVGLQEVDVGRERTDLCDQPTVLAGALGYEHAFSAALHDGHGGAYGNVVLSRFPIVERLTLTLPGVSVWRAEPRCALEAVIATPFGRLAAWSLHLGVRQVERARQTAGLLARLRRPMQEAELAPLVMMGDFNAGPSSVLARTLGTWLRDARKAGGGATYPSRLPLLALDHVFVSAPLRVTRAYAHRSPATSIASDHLPFVAELAWDDPPARVVPPAFNRARVAAMTSEPAASARRLR